MEKTVLLIIVFWAFHLSTEVCAQDTIHSRTPQDGYFTDVWPASFVNGGTDTFRCNQTWFTAEALDVIQAYKKFSKDTLTIYGIAAGMISDKDLDRLYHRPWHGEYRDTTYNELYDYLRVFEAGPTEPIPIGERLKVHMHVTPIAYYLDMDAYTIYGNDRHPVIPMYECYFHTPVVVADSFYVGRECHACRYDPEYNGTTMPILLARIGPAPSDNVYVYQHSCDQFYSPSPLYPPYDTNTLSWIYETDNYEFTRRIPLLFPILTPPPPIGRDTTSAGTDTISVGDTVIVFDTVIVSDTTIIDNDTIITYDTIITADTILSINNAGFLDRMIGVMPNPAAETARVVSSFGIVRVEAFNAAGVRIQDIKVGDGSLAANLDVRKWPDGTYILRIHTPYGVATKKLAVRR